jgi:hypothetical protein
LAADDFDHTNANGAKARNSKAQGAFVSHINLRRLCFCAFLRFSLGVYLKPAHGAIGMVQSNGGVFVDFVGVFARY